MFFFLDDLGIVLRRLASPAGHMTPEKAVAGFFGV